VVLERTDETHGRAPRARLPRRPPTFARVVIGVTIVIVIVVVVVEHTRVARSRAVVIPSFHRSIVPTRTDDDATTQPYARKHKKHGHEDVFTTTDPHTTHH
jgi:hypothetical protein